MLHSNGFSTAPRGQRSLVGLPLASQPVITQNSAGGMSCAAEPLNDADRFNQNEMALLAAILSNGGSKRHAELSARALLGYFRSLARVLSAPEAHILAVPFLKRRDARLIKSAYATILEAVTAPLLDKPLLNSEALINLVLWTIGQSHVEQVQLISVDGDRLVIGSDVICSGSEKSVSVTPRTIIAAALRRGARAIVVAHNHPGGSVEPSDDDILLTRQLSQATAMVGIRLLDHVIVAAPAWFSFSAIGYL